MSDPIEKYLQLPYHIRLVRDQWEDGTLGWFAEIEELPGCMTQGESPDETVARLRDAMHSWIEDALERGESIPLPRREEGYSGKFLLRVPRNLHAALARQAETDGVSLNAFVATALAYAIGARDGQRRYGTTKSGRPITDELIAEFAAEAEAGYDF
jgi:predicted RNase H-like HicB family nuclease